MAIKKTKAAPKAKKKTAPKKAAAPKKAKATTKPELETKDMDRKVLAATARQAKKELLAIRFNLQAPSLKEYRRKRAELQKLLAQLN